MTKKGCCKRLKSVSKNVPVFPDVGSMMVSPSFSSPFFSASSTILRAMRSLTLPPALKNSHFATGKEEKIEKLCSVSAEFHQIVPVYNSEHLFPLGRCLYSIDGVLPTQTENESNSNSWYVRRSHLMPSALTMLFILIMGVLPMLYSTLGMMPIGDFLKRDIQK